MTAPAPAAVLGRPAVAGVGRRATARHLRVLAYHGVPDAGPFRAHLDHLVAHFRPVTGAQVAASLDGGPPLPDRAVWVTFDDGRPSVVEVALPELARAGVPATLFVCPGVVADGAPYWFDVVAAAVGLPGGFRHEGRDRSDAGLVTELKAVPDGRRREVAAAALERVVDAGAATPRQLTPEELRSWLDAGQEVGNHTWDHPCLDTCTPAEQGAQVRRAHEALEGLLGERPTLFAYPNGDWTPDAESALAACGYRVGALFDHRLAARRSAPLRLSRLRVDAGAPADRFRAITSGWHSGVYRAAGAVRSAVRR